MDILTTHQKEVLLENGKSGLAPKDMIPYVLITSMNFDKWLICEISEHNNDLAFGLYSINEENPTLGFFNLNVFDNYRFSDLLNNRGFSANYRISVFKKVADQIGYIPTKTAGIESYFEKADRLTY